ncbi:MAG: hypothetical protein NPINA01_11080 [Nitrospinaceae bacterium]|nr:MAG: hypothetical protein NPINA01_11080 [Nitrospinaceae bacterium]
MPAIKFVISILFLICLAAFAVLNRGSVPVFYYDLQFLKQSLEVPLVLVVLIPFAMGFVIAWSFMVVNRVKSNAMINKRNRTIASLNEELERFKAHPQIPASVSSQHRD